MNKLEILKTKLKSYDSVAIAYSGGVDSTFLAKAAYDVLGDKAVAITIIGDMHPHKEVIEAREIAHSIGIKLIEIDLRKSDIPEFNKNNIDRCYHCKKFLFNTIKSRAGKENISIILDGTNLDDVKDYRPGLAALEELKIYSPLKEAILTKEDIRAYSKELNLITWDKPSFACLASRIPYGDPITRKKLKMVEKAEDILKNKNIKQYRVRHHGDIARIEVERNDMSKLLSDENYNDLLTSFEEIGFKYVTLDLRGYVQGSLNKFDTEGGKNE